MVNSSYVSYKLPSEAPEHQVHRPMDLVLFPSLSHTLSCYLSLSHPLSLSCYISLSHAISISFSLTNIFSLSLSIYLCLSTYIPHALSLSISLTHILSFSIYLSIYLSISPYIKCSLARRLACNKKTRAPNHRLSDNNAPTSITLILLSSPAFLLSS